MNLRKIVKGLIPTALFRKIEPFGHLQEAILLNTINGFPWRGVKVIGVTGTNGKSTTCFLIHRMMVEAGYKVGLMTTIAYGVGDNLIPQDEHMTTSSVPKLLKRLKLLKSQGAEWVILETTSQALAQNRVWGVKYYIAAMTNITHEHLDYHGTFERYRDAKRKMFKMTNRNRTGLRLGVINADDPSSNLFAKDVKKPLLYGIDNGELRANNVKSTPSGVSYTAQLEGKTYDIKCRLPGSFNIYNSLAAVGVGHSLGLSERQVEQGIAALESVEGRMARVDAGQQFEVIVDYAHTPDSFEKLFKDLRPKVRGKLIVMFGSAGRRDKAKRPVQGELAGRYADEVIITEEDDRDIDGQQIMQEIAAGAEQAGKALNSNLFLVHNREDAVKFAIGRAKTKDDVVLLLGKGHEKTIEGPNGERPYDELLEATKALKEVK